MFLKTKATDGVNTVIKAASRVAKLYNNNKMTCEHILYGLALNEHSEAGKVLSHFNITSVGILGAIEKPEATTESDIPLNICKKAERAFNIASQITEDLKGEFLGTEHLLLALLTDRTNEAVKMIEQVFEVKVENLKEAIINLLEKDLINIEKLQEDIEDMEKRELAISNLPQELQALGEDVTLLAYNKKIDPIIGREKEIERVIEVLCRKSKNNPIIIGKPGVGKSAVVYGLAQQIVKGNVPHDLQNKILYSLDIGSLMAGTKYRGALEEKLKKVIEIISSREDIILFVDEIHTIMQAGEGKGEVSPADMLKPYLARGDIKTVGATTISEYQKFIQKDKALERRFQPIKIDAPNKEDTIKILKGLREGYETYHKVKITDEALVAAVDLSERYIPDRNLPDKAIDLIDEASSKAKLNKNSYLQGKNTLEKSVLEEDIQEDFDLLQEEEQIIVDKEQVANIVSIWTGIPITKITQSEKEKLLNLEEHIKQRIVGQTEAIEAVSGAIRRARVGLKDISRPIGSFIFIGQTGVGKTELCKALAHTMFGQEDAMLRIDMSEFTEAHSVSKLIGAPAGYVGYEDGGVLTDWVRQKPYSVILFDEMEKAHRNIFNLLLQVLEDGRLTDSKGNTIDFKNTIIIFTSNIGVERLQKAKREQEFLGKTFDKPASKDLMLKELKKYVRDEFINRIDHIILFESLKRQELAQITKLMIIKLNQKLSKKQLELKLTQNAFKYLITKGTNEAFGARPLRRVIEQEIEDRISQDLLTGQLQENSNIIIDFKENELQFIYLEKK